MSERKNIVFSTEETIRNISDAHENLSRAFAEAADILVDTSSISEVDVAFVQLIEAARKTAGAEQKQISMKVPASGALLDVLKRGGFLETQNDVSFWLCE